MSPGLGLGRTTFGGPCVTTDYQPIRTGIDLQSGVIEPPVQDVDRSMDVLQYATAFIAALVAVLLAVVH